MKYLIIAVLILATSCQGPIDQDYNDYIEQVIEDETGHKIEIEVK
jgi:Tfp pilus assembly protein PilP